MTAGGGLVAIVRPPTDALARCELTHVPREPLDVVLARDQHAAYAATLRDLGADVIVLAPEPELPDAVFVEDTAVVLDEVAVITNPGAMSRQPEVAGVATTLAPFRPLVTITPPATLDGGDVLVMGRTLYVGRSSRTNAAAIAQLAAHLLPYDYAVRPVDVTGCLHLKSACTYVGDGVILANPQWADTGPFAGAEILPVAPGEPRAGNTFRVGGTVVMADSFPLTRGLLEGRGFTVRTVAVSELQKAEAGGSCMSLIFTARACSSSRSR